MPKTLPVAVKFKAIDELSKAVEAIQAKFPKLTEKVKLTNRAFDAMTEKTKAIQKRLKDMGDATQNVGKKMSLFITAPVTAAGFLAIKSFADFETALVGVGKTTNLQGAELEALGKKFQDLSLEIPVSANELLGLGQTAAQLGVTGGDNVLKFSATLAKLATATNIVGEEGAADLARFIQITGGSVSEVEKFGSALVELGNTSAATEAEILSFSTRLGAATAVFNVNSTQVLGLATALKSIGIEAEAGSSSVQRAMGAINESINKGGMKMQVLSKLTKISTGDLKKRFKDDAVGVLQEFAKGLQRVEKNGGDLTQAMEFFGLSGVRDIQVLGSLAKNTDLLQEKLKTAKSGFDENTALQKEFAAASQTLNAQWVLFKNNLTAGLVEIGEKLKPFAVGFLEAANSVVTFFRSHPDLTKWLAVAAAIAAIFGPILIGIGAIISILPAFLTGIKLVTAGMAFFGITSFAALAPILLLIAKFVLIGSLIVGLVALVWKFRDAIMSGLVTAFEKLWGILTKINPVFALLNLGIKKFFGAGANPLQVEGQVEGPQAAGPALAPQGAPLGGLEAQSRANPEFFSQTNNARVDINVRAPMSTSVVSEQQGGFLNINRGFAGAF